MKKTIIILIIFFINIPIFFYFGCGFFNALPAEKKNEKYHNIDIPFIDISSVISDNQENIYLFDSYFKRIAKYNLNGIFIDSLYLNNNFDEEVYELSIDNNNNLYLGYSYSDSIYIINFSNKLVDVIKNPQKDMVRRKEKLVWYMNEDGNIILNKKIFFPEYSQKTLINFNPVITGTEIFTNYTISSRSNINPFSATKRCLIKNIEYKIFKNTFIPYVEKIKKNNNIKIFSNFTYKYLTFSKSYVLTYFLMFVISIIILSIIEERKKKNSEIKMDFSKANFKIIIPAIFIPLALVYYGYKNNSKEYMMIHMLIHGIPLLPFLSLCIFTIIGLYKHDNA